MRLRLILLRHGETDWNRVGRATTERITLSQCHQDRR
jgi:broad specificity phosphatase PhoE